MEQKNIKKTYITKTIIRIVLLTFLLLLPFCIYGIPFIIKNFKYPYFVVFLGVSFIFAFIVFISMFINLKNFIAPLENLYLALKDSKHGKFVPVDVDNNLFVKDIFDYYNHTIKHIVEKDNQLKTTNRFFVEYKKAIESASIVSKADKDGIITYVNENFCKISGYTKDKLIGKSYSEIAHFDMKGSFFDDLLKTVQSKQIWQGEIKNKKKDGGYYRIFTTIIPILDSNETIQEYLSIGFDITKEKDLEYEEKNQIQHQLSERDRALLTSYKLQVEKDNFINIASHELRTPMTAIKGYLSMILDGDFGPLQDNIKLYLEKIYQNINRLIQMVNDMLDVAKLDSGKMQFFYEDFDFEKLVGDVCFDMKALFDNKNLKLNLDLPSGVIIYGDITKTRQIIINLVGNAIKFTNPGGNISIKAQLNGDFLVVDFIDSGIGIPQDQIDKIFEKFGQVKDSYTRNIGGTGLGLPIVKSILKHIGGSISVQSKLGQGSTFTVHLPLKRKQL